MNMSSSLESFTSDVELVNVSESPPHYKPSSQIAMLNNLIDKEKEKEKDKKATRNVSEIGHVV